MTSKRPVVYLILLCLLSTFAGSGCVKQRTVSQNGRVVSENLVVERPVRNAIRAGR
jgi:hypothetical protein